MALQPKVRCPLGDIYAINAIRTTMYLRDKSKLFFFTKTHATYIFESYFIKNHESLGWVPILALPFPAD